MLNNKFNLILKTKGKLLLKTILILIILLLQQTIVYSSDFDKSKLLRMDVGFAHWFADSFRSGEQGKNLSFGLGVKPSLNWLSLQYRYEFNEIRMDSSNKYFSELNGRHIEFHTIGLYILKTFTQGDQSVTVSYGIYTLIVDVDGRKTVVSPSLNGGFYVDYIFGHGMGIFMDAREQGYQLVLADGSKTDRQIDFNISVGFVMYPFSWFK